MKNHTHALYWTGNKNLKLDNQVNGMGYYSMCLDTIGNQLWDLKSRHHCEMFEATICCCCYTVG